MSRNYTLRTTHSRRHSAALFHLHKIKPSFSRCPSLKSCCDRFLTKCLMTQRSTSSFGPAGGATARWQGGESVATTLSGSSLVARVRVRCPMSKFSDFQKAGLLNNYYTPVLKYLHICILGSIQIRGTYIYSTPYLACFLVFVDGMASPYRGRIRPPE